MSIQSLSWIPMLLLSLGISNLYAQRKIENIGLRFVHFTTSEVIDTLGNKDYRKLKVGTQEWELYANIPTRLGKKTLLNHSLSYNLLHFAFQRWPEDIANNERPNNLHAVQYALSLQQNWTKGWSTHLQIQPGLASDFQASLNNQDITIQGAAWIRKAFNQKNDFWLGLGLSYNNLLGESQLLPLVDFYWQTKKFIVNGLLPYYGEIYYRPLASLQIGFAGRIQGNQYRVHIERQDKSTMSELQYNIIYGGPSVVWNVHKNLSLTLEGGMIINRTQEVFDQSNKTVADFDPDKFEWSFFQGKLAFSLK